MRGDSYSAFERKIIGPFRMYLAKVTEPLVRALNALGVPPNAVSFSQIPIGLVFVILIQDHPRWAFTVFLLTLFLDGIDGALARASGKASSFGALFDQLCDHTRETLVIAGLAAVGALSPFSGVLYAFTYVAFNFSIYIANYFERPVPLAIKSYLIVYPAMFLYLWFGTNWLEPAVDLSIALMWAVMIQAFIGLRQVMR